MKNSFHQGIHPNIFNVELFFNGELGNHELLREIEKYLVTKTVDIKGYSRHFLGIVLDEDYSGFSTMETEKFKQMSSYEKLEVFEKMMREYAAVYKAQGVHYVDFARVFGLDYRFTRTLYDSVLADEIFQSSSKRRTRYDGWELPYAWARHFGIFGQSRTGKSVTAVKISDVCMKNDWTIVDINDSNGRMETGATAFSLFDSKVTEILKTRWKEARVDSKTSAQRMISDIDSLRKVVSQYADLENVEGCNVIYYHPLVEGIPPVVPKTDRFRIEFFVFSVVDLFEMSNSSNYRRMFGVFGEELTDTDIGSLAHIKRFLESERKIETVSLSEVIRLISELHETKEEVAITYADGASRRVDFADKSVKRLINKLEKVNDVGFFKPAKILRDGVLVDNPDLFNVERIVSSKNTYNCLTTKWANPDLKYVVIAYFLDKLMELKRKSVIKERVAILCRELYELAPPKPKGLENLTFDALKRIFAGGADIGIRMIVDSQQVMQVSREVKRNLHGFVIHRIVDRSDKDDLRASHSKHYMPREYKDLISELGMGEAIVLYGNQAVILKVIPVHYMSKIEGTDTFSLLMVYADDKIETKELFSPDRYKSIGMDKVAMTGKNTALYPRLLKKIDVGLSDNNELQILTALSMILRKDEYASFEDVCGAVAVLYDDSPGKFSNLSTDEIHSYLVGDNSKRLSKFIIADIREDAFIITLDNEVFGYKTGRDVAMELFVELLVMFGLNVNEYL